jgi:succinate dehydrogenase / fumarate reductase membrane anchor subunit
MTGTARKRPEFRNINALTDLPSYRLPVAGWVSILHRASGAMLFFMMPFIIWLFDTSVTSELSYATFAAAFNVGLGFVPGWFIKCVAPLGGRRAPFVHGHAPRRDQRIWQHFGHFDFGYQLRPERTFGRQVVWPLLISGAIYMSVNYGSKRVVVGAHYGIRDWLAQRITAALMAAFTLVVLLQVIFTQGPLGYEGWAGIFASQWMKFLTFIVIIALLYHAWIGMRDIWMDYIKPLGLRLFLHVASLIWLIGCAGWAIQVLWRL